VLIWQGDAAGKGDRDAGAGGATVVIRGVPARVCGNCGEEYIDEPTTAELLKTADAAAQAGVQVDVRDYIAA
jgi:YgiT-type zinc finger domain-containing protein